MNKQNNKRLSEIEKAFNMWKTLQEECIDDEKLFHIACEKMQALDEEADKIRRELEELQEVPTTRVSLRPLRKMAQLKKLRACNCMAVGYEGDMFVMTFQIDNTERRDVFQDLTIIFEKRFPRVYISKPYTQNNAVTKIRGGVVDEE